MKVVKVIGKYLSIYREYLSNAFAEATSFRLNFFLVMVLDLLFYASTLGSAELIFENVGQIGFWNRDQFQFFLSFMLAVDHLHMTFVSENFWNFSVEVRTGKLDFILTKPVSAIFACFFRLLRPATMLNGFVPWALMVWFGRRLDLPLASWAAMPFMVLLGTSLMVSLDILITLVGFWTVAAYGLNFLRMQFQQVARLPDFVYQVYVRRIFTLGFPILAIGSGPVRFMLEKGWPTMTIVTIVATLVCMIAIRFVWEAGLAAYESASS